MARKISVNNFRNRNESSEKEKLRIEKVSLWHSSVKKYATAVILGSPIMRHAHRMKHACCAILFVILLMTFLRAGQSQSAAVQPTAQLSAQPAPSDARYRAGQILYSEDFRHGLGDWRIEMEKLGSAAASGSVTANDGTLDIDVPAGVTVWFNHKLEGPLMITYQATVISAGGANDRVSDLNSFWMATDPTSPADIFAHPRSGRFAGYNQLHLYYVGLGGNGNKTTRFRRYIGDAVDRPLLPENDLSVAEHPDKGIVANKTQTITMIADGELIQYWRDGVKIFEMADAAPYTKGWFGIRTTKNHMQIRNLGITRLVARE
jgi:hypothetical protein